MDEIFVREVTRELRLASEELIKAAAPKPLSVFVVGCSTSEVQGERIGTCANLALAREMFAVLREEASKHFLFLAVQCCEHLNRALVMERSVLERYNFEEVTVRPVEHAGGSLAAAAYEGFDDPVVLESVRADLGLDIGQTLIGMHLKRVAVPVRLPVRTIGKAIITAARTRPPLIGGERAQYPAKIR